MRISTLVMAIAMAVLASARTDAAVFDDNFSYPDGNLTDNPPWTAHSGAGNAPIQVSGGEIAIVHGSGSREDVGVDFADLTSGIVYYGFHFRVPDLGSPVSGTDAEYFAHFMAGSSFVGRADIVAAGGSGDFSVGIATFGSTADQTWASDLTFDTTYRLVVGYNIDTDQAELWIDPTSVSDTSILGADGNASLTVDRIAFRASTSSANETILVDNLVVSTSFLSAAAIPEPSSLSLLVFAGVVGTVARRRR